MSSQILWVGMIVVSFSTRLFLQGSSPQACQIDSSGEPPKNAMQGNTWPNLNLTWMACWHCGFCSRSRAHINGICLAPSRSEFGTYFFSMRTRSGPGHVGPSHLSGDAESLEARGILVQNVQGIWNNLILAYCRQYWYHWKLNNMWCTVVQWMFIRISATDEVEFYCASDVVIEVIKGRKAKQDKALEGNGVQFGSVDREFLGDEFDNICWWCS